MSLKYVLGYALYISSLVLAKPLDPPAHPARSLEVLQHLANISNLMEFATSETNESISSLDEIGNQKLHIQCDGSAYGFNLDISDCEEAKAYLPINADQVQWAERHTGWQKQIFLLPYRSMGDKASCYVQPVLIDGVTSARATPNEVRNAAAAIRNKCASGGKLQGGIATEIGEKRVPFAERPRRCYWPQLLASEILFAKPVIAYALRS